MNIPLSNGLFVMVDDEDYALVSSYRWYARKHRHTWYALANVQRGDGTKDKTGRSRKRTIKMHRLILKADPGELGRAPATAAGP